MKLNLKIRIIWNVLINNNIFVSIKNIPTLITLFLSKDDPKIIYDALSEYQSKLKKNNRIVDSLYTTDILNQVYFYNKHIKDNFKKRI